MVGSWSDQYTFTALASYQKEIAHAVLLPDNEEGEILFWCLPDCNGPNGYPTETYLWKRWRPQNVTVEPVPKPTPQHADGAADLKGAGHTFLPNGDLIAVGGTNWSLECPTILQGAEQFFGHSHVFRFPKSASPRDWSHESQQIVLNRWYPTALTVNTGDVIALGSGGYHTGSPPPSETYDYFTSGGPNPGWNTSILENTQTPCASALRHLVHWYPPAIMLATSRELMNANPYDNAAGAHYVSFLELDPANFECPPTRRWKLGALNPPQNRLGYANVVHLVLPNPNLPSAHRDVVYRIGGALHHQPEYASAYAARMIQPSTTSLWDDASVPDLNFSRVGSNTVILADGSIAVFDGEAYDSSSSSAIGRKHPERLKIREVFAPNGPEPSWEVMAESDTQRAEHSVALLLPDGSVWTAGGKSPTGSSYPHHRMAIFHPPYLHMGSRPEIVEIEGNWSYSHSSTTVEIKVEGYVGTPQFPPEPYRVALIRNGSVTHHFDSSQRYVDLQVTEHAVLPNGIERLKVNKPASNWFAPPGYYMLFVIRADGVPSHAKWIQVLP